MNPKISVIFVIVILSSLSYGVSHEKIIRSANNYKDYNEFTENITEVKFNDKSYFVIDFSSQGYPSGCIILNNEGHVVKNKTIIAAILLMRILKKYDKEIDNWARISSSFKSFSSLYSKDKSLSKTFLDLSFMSNKAHSHLRRCVFDSSPGDALEFITLEKRILSGTILAINMVKDKDIERKAELIEYLEDLKDFLNMETENLNRALDISMSDIETRIRAREERESIHAATIEFITGIFVLVLLLILIKRFKGKD